MFSSTNEGGGAAGELGVEVPGEEACPMIVVKWEERLGKETRLEEVEGWEWE